VFWSHDFTLFIFLPQFGQGGGVDVALVVLNLQALQTKEIRSSGFIVGPFNFGQKYNYIC